MHILTLSARLELGPKDILEPGRYISTDVVAAQLLLMADGDGSMTPLEESRPAVKMPLAGADWSGKKILIQRGGGFGDLVLMTPVLREIKRRWPTCHLAISTMSHYSVCLLNLPFVDEILPFPVPMEIAEKYEAWVFYENAVEKNSHARELHITEVFGEIAGIKSITDLKPEYRVKPTEAIWANEAYPREPGKMRIAVQVGAAAKLRRYPLWGETCSEMSRRGWEIMLLGTPGELSPMDPKKTPPGIKNLTALGLTFRQSCAVLNGCDAFAGSDTALLHVAGALGVPAVGLYGPFPWRLRTAHCPTTVALSGIGECAPCFHHVGPTMRQDFPDKCPSKAKGFCEVLASIKPERIVAKIDQIARRLDGHPDVIKFPEEVPV